MQLLKFPDFIGFLKFPDPAWLNREKYHVTQFNIDKTVAQKGRQTRFSFFFFAIGVDARAQNTARRPTYGSTASVFVWSAEVTHPQGT